MTSLILIFASLTQVMADEFKPLTVKPTAVKTQKAVTQPAVKTVAPPTIAGKPSTPANASGTPAATKDSSLLPPTTSTGTPAVLGQAPTAAPTGGVAPSDVAGPSPYGYIRPPYAYTPPPPVVIQQAAPINPMSSMPNLGGGGTGPSTSAPTPQNYYTPRTATPYYQGPSTATPGISPSNTSTNPAANFSRSLDMPSAGSCGKPQDLWSAVKNLDTDGPLKPNSGYDINATAWPTLVSTNGKVSVSFPAGAKTMCNSATATAFEKHIADLCTSGDLTLNSAEIAFLNGSVAHNAFNGNTYAAAYFYDQLGGKSMIGTSAKGSIASVLAQAKPGDILKFDRKAGTGHSTIFKDVENGKVCYWASNTPTNGTGVNCESIDSLTDVAVSRFPSDTKDLPKRIDAMMNSASLKQKFSSSKADIKASDVKVASSLDCSVSSQRGVASDPAQPGSNAGAK